MKDKPIKKIRQKQFMFSLLPILYYLVGMIILPILWNYNNLFDFKETSICYWIVIALLTIQFVVAVPIMKIHLKGKIEIFEDYIVLNKVISQYDKSKENTFLVKQLIAEPYKRVLKTQQFNFKDVVKYGNSFDLDVEKEEVYPPAKQNCPQKTAREIVFVLKNGETCNLNINNYSEKDITYLLRTIKSKTNIEPTGRLRIA